MDEARRLQLDRFKAMTPAERWQAAKDLYWSARRLKAAFLRSKHPDWDEAAIQEAVKRSFRHARP